MDQADENTSRRSPHHPADAVGWLRSLQARLVGFRGPDDLNEVVTSLSTALDEVLAEHGGMAEELISAYEQLGIIFEVTRKLPDVQGEADVTELFVSNLRRSFPGWRALTVRPDPSGESGEWVGNGRTSDNAGQAPALPAWMAAAVGNAIRSGSVAVAQREGASHGADVLHGGTEVMAAGVLAGGAPVCAVVLVRTDGSPAFRAVDMMLLESLATYCGDLVRNQRLVRELRTMSISMVRSLVSAVDQKDEYTCGHSLRVGYYATELGKRLHLREIELQMLQWSALLHDVGKIGIRDAVLKKEGKLTAEEFDHIKEHPVRSHRVVQGVPQLADALVGILHHHERWNGTGYPAGLKGEEIPLQARIIQMADMFDALTSTRSYRPAFDWQKALAIIEEEAGTTVDPDLQKVFDKMIREELETDPQAWGRMVARAERFAQVWEALEAPVGVA